LTVKVNYPALFFYILLSLLPFIYIVNLYDKVELPRFSFIALLTIPAFITLIFSKLQSNSFNWHTNILFVLMLVFFSAISIIWGGTYGSYEEQIIKLVIFSFVFLIATQSIDLKQLQTLFFISIFSASIVALIGILQKFNFNPFNLLQFNTSASTFINRNFAANYLDLIIPINFILLIHSKTKQKVWLLTISLCLLLSYILIINVLGTWLAFSVFFIFFIFALRHLDYLKKEFILFSSKYKTALIALIFIPLFIFILPGKGMSFHTEFKKYTDLFAPYSSTSTSTLQSSFTVRKHAYLTALDMVKDKPLIGVGLGNFHIAFRSYARAANSEHKVFADLIYLHNDILQTFVEIGLIGGGILFLIIGNTLFFTMRFLKNHVNDIPLTTEQITKKLYALGLLLALLSSGFHAFVSFPLHQATSGFIFYLWLGLLTSLLSNHFKISQSISISFKIILIILPIFMFSVLNNYNNQIKSNFYIDKARLSFKKKNCSQAIKYADKSMDYYAKDYYPQSWAISIYAKCVITDENKKLHLAEKILANNPLHPWALKMAAIIYFKQGQYVYAEQNLKLLVSLYPTYPAPHIELGNAMYMQQKYIKAQKQYIKALSLNPQHAEAYRMLQKVEQKIELNAHSM